jgi:hypothetical protein
MEAGRIGPQVGPAAARADLHALGGHGERTLSGCRLPALAEDDPEHGEQPDARRDDDGKSSPWIHGAAPQDRMGGRAPGARTAIAANLRRVLPLRQCRGGHGQRDPGQKFLGRLVGQEWPPFYGIPMRADRWPAREMTTACLTRPVEEHVHRQFRGPGVVPRISGRLWSLAHGYESPGECMARTTIAGADRLSRDLSPPVLGCRP